MIEKLKLEIENLDIKRKEMVEELLRVDKSFDTWLKYSEKRTDFWLPDVEEEAPLLYKFLGLEDLCESGYEKYETATIDHVVDRISDKDNEDETKYLELKQELMSVNFGSMEINW